MRKWIRRIGLGLVGLVTVAAIGLYGGSEWRLGQRFDVAAETLVVPTDEASLARGRHLVETVAACANCHGADLGGKLFFDGGWAVGRLPSANLTRGRGGVGGRYSDRDWVRAIRHGVAPDGRPLVFMPPHDFGRLTRHELAAIVAYLKQVAPVDREMAPMHLGPVGRFAMLTQAGMLLPATRIDHAASIPEHAPTDLVARGEQLASISGCRACHSPDLTGGAGPPPGASNITPAGLRGWTEEDFRRTLRTGRTPRGRELALSMPREFASLSDDELRALWAYLRSVPAGGAMTEGQQGS